MKKALLLLLIAALLGSCAVGCAKKPAEGLPEDSTVGAVTQTEPTTSATTSP